jgi:hypothetical protein
MARKQDDDILAGPQGEPQSAYGAPSAEPRRSSGYQRQSIGEAIAKSFIRSIASSLGRILVRVVRNRMR